MEMVLDRYKPKLVIFDIEPAFDIEVYNADNNHKRYLTHLRPYYNKRGIDRIFKDISYEEWCKVHFGMMRYNTVIVPMAIDNLINRGVEDRGFNPEFGQMKEDREVENQIAVIDYFKLHYVKRLIELTQEHGVQLLFAASPKYGVRDSRTLDPIREICNEDNIPFLDYYSDTSFVCHKEYFKEPMHLNAEGAKNYSTKISDRIRIEFLNN